MTEELKMSKFGINFISAKDAGLILSIKTAEGEIERRARDSQDVADWIKEFGLAEACYFSSTMDFAAEEGFPDDDAAIRIFDRGVTLACAAA